MTDDHLQTERKTPPEEHEWPHVWRVLGKAEKAWLIVAPFHAVVTNWKALVFVLFMIAWLNRPEIADALNTLLSIKEGGQ